MKGSRLITGGLLVILILSAYWLLLAAPEPSQSPLTTVDERQDDPPPADVAGNAPETEESTQTTLELASARLEAGPAQGADTTGADTAGVAGDDSPMVQRIVDLSRKVQAGDKEAGCRLHTGLRRCWAQQQRQQAAQMTMDILSEMAPENESSDALPAAMSDTLLTLAAMMPEPSSEVDAFCAGLGPEHYDQHFDALLRTARAGDPAAMLSFATGGGFLALEYARQVDRFDLWRREAPGMLRAAIESGLRDAAHVRVTTMGNPNTLLGALLPVDPVEHYALVRVLERTGPAPRGGNQYELTAEQVAAGDRLAEQIYSDFFFGRYPSVQQAGSRPSATALMDGMRDAMDPRLHDCKRSD